MTKGDDNKLFEGGEKRGSCVKKQIEYVCVEFLNVVSLSTT
jgi:hypothetical protein